MAKVAYSEYLRKLSKISDRDHGGFASCALKDSADMIEELTRRIEELEAEKKAKVAE